MKPQNSKIDARMKRIGGQDQKPGRASMPGYDLDDEVFFRGDKGPLSGRLVSRGKHGCTVDEPCGKRHQVQWDGLLGLKTRKTYPARVIERGSGGAILERQDGARFFVAGGVPGPDEPEDVLSYDESGFVNGAQLQKSDTLARLEECLALLAVPPAPRRLPAGLPLLWGGDVS